jgi:hypothetical protein
MLLAAELYGLATLLPLRCVDVADELDSEGVWPPYFLVSYADAGAGGEFSYSKSRWSPFWLAALGGTSSIRGVGQSGITFTARDSLRLGNLRDCSSLVVGVLV